MFRIFSTSQDCRVDYFAFIQKPLRQSTSIIAVPLGILFSYARVLQKWGGVEGFRACSTFGGSVLSEQVLQV